MSRGRRSGADEEEVEESPADVSACRVTEDRHVFVEADNTDGWIASDTTVDLVP